MEEARFYYSIDGENYIILGDSLNATVLSDDYYENHGFGNRFTGAFIGICSQDLTGVKQPAYFDFFEYKEI